MIVAKKRHHYVPRAYLKFFSNEQGRVRVYRKDDPDKVIHLSPDNTAFHKHYYSQPTSDGNRDTDALEDLFSDLETCWPPIVERLGKGEDVNDSLDDIYAFISLQYARVSANRDACELMLAESVKSAARSLDTAGWLPPKPEGLEGILDRIDVSIDPHQSIHAMVTMIEGVGDVLHRIGIGDLHNKTTTPFLSSDNPVIWFDPSIGDAGLRPYALDPDGPIVFLFPVTPNLLIYGHSSMRTQFSNRGFSHSELQKAAAVEDMNKQICRFAYQTIFAQDDTSDALVKKHSGCSPVLRSRRAPTQNGEITIHDRVFGNRSAKPKWQA